MARLAYLRQSIRHQFAEARFRCPNCASTQSRVVDRKFLTTQLRRCLSCELLFRTPTDEETVRFYEEEYEEGFATEMPDASSLAQLKQQNFKGTEKDSSCYINLLLQLGLPARARIFDFGCSWGYGSYQLAQSGFDVMAFEIASNRRRYAHANLAVR